MSAPLHIDAFTELDDTTDFHELASEGLRGNRGGAGHSDAAPVDWFLRAYPRLRGTHYANQLSRAVAGCLTDDDPYVRFQALQFFESFAGAAGGERVVEIANGNRALFVNVDHPWSPGTTLESQLLRSVGARILAGDPKALALGYVEALRPGEAASLVGALTQTDPGWVANHAEEIVRANPDAGGPILVNLQKSPINVGDVGVRIAPLAAQDPNFRMLVSDFLLDPARARVLASLK